MLAELGVVLLTGSAVNMVTTCLFKSSTTQGMIDQIWKRSGICVENSQKQKLYPKMIRIGWNGHNRVFYYRLPLGLPYSKITKNLESIVTGIKAEVIPKYLENDRKAHFSLTVLSGHLMGYIEYTNEYEKLKKDGLWVPLGWSRRGLEQLNLASNNSPHLMIGGGTGAGKSTLARTIMVALHQRYSRAEVRLWLCDLKHGNDIAMLGDNPALVDRIINEPEQVVNIMDDLGHEIRRRYELFKDEGCTDIRAYNKDRKRKLPHIICFLDELTKLEGKEFADARAKMAKVTGEARGAGVHIMTSCHRPTANLIPGTMKNNITAVVAFRCNPVSARVLLGDDEWENAMYIDKDIEGRALFRFKDEVMMQVPYITDDQCREIMSHYQKKGGEKPAPKAEIIKTA